MANVVATGSTSNNVGTAHHKGFDEAVEIALTNVVTSKGGKGKDQNVSPYSVGFTLTLATNGEIIYGATLSR